MVVQTKLTKVNRRASLQAWRGMHVENGIFEIKEKVSEKNKLYICQCIECDVTIPPPGEQSPTLRPHGADIKLREEFHLQAPCWHSATYHQSVMFAVFQEFFCKEMF